MKIVILFVSIFLTGCATVQQYDGQRRDSSEVSVIKKQKHTHGKVYVSEINGKWRGLGAKDWYEFLPGPVTLEVSYNSKVSVGNAIIVKADLEAGKSYMLRHAISNGIWRAWIEEMNDVNKRLLP